MTTMIVPVAKADDTDEGQYEAVTVAEGTVALPGGLYKLAAVGTSLSWKVGATALVATKGSYLGAGDQELVLVEAPVLPATTRTLRFIRAPDATADGLVNITVADVFKVPGVDARPYLTPTS